MHYTYTFVEWLWCANIPSALSYLPFQAVFMVQPTGNRVRGDPIPGRKPVRWLWERHRGFQDAHAESLQCLIHGGREDAVPVMDQVLIRVVEGQEPAKLLGGPSGENQPPLRERRTQCETSR